MLQYVLTGKELIRQYYHSRTNLHMADGEWEYDSDDDPIDDAWIHQLNEKVSNGIGRIVYLMIYNVLYSVMVHGWPLDD